MSVTFKGMMHISDGDVPAGTLYTKVYPDVGFTVGGHVLALVVPTPTFDTG